MSVLTLFLSLDLLVSLGNIIVFVRFLECFQEDQTVFPVNYCKYSGLIVSELKPTPSLFPEL